MALTIDQKQLIVAEVSEVAGKAMSAVGAMNSGLTVAQMTAMRVKARQSGVYLRVIKNTLARRAMADTPYSCMSEALTGPLLLAFSMEDPGSAARLMRDFAKDFAKLDIKVIALGGKLVPVTDIDRVASLPTREEALSQLLSVMKAPIGKLARILNEVPSKLVRTVDAVRNQKQAA
ncbi:MAG: 50S ribosomal protein L10 [Halothiobacillus sp.]